MRDGRRNNLQHARQREKYCNVNAAPHRRGSEGPRFHDARAAGIDHHHPHRRQLRDEHGEGMQENFSGLAEEHFRKRQDERLSTGIEKREGKHHKALQTRANAQQTGIRAHPILAAMIFHF